MMNKNEESGDSNTPYSVFDKGCIKCSHHGVIISFTINSLMPLAYIYWSANQVVMFTCIIIFQVEL